MGVSKNRGTPKWMVKIMENPIKMDDLGGYHYFQKHSYTNSDSHSMSLDYAEIIHVKTWSRCKGEPINTYPVGICYHHCYCIASYPLLRFCNNCLNTHCKCRNISLYIYNHYFHHYYMFTSQYTYIVQQVIKIICTYHHTYFSPCVTYTFWTTVFKTTSSKSVYRNLSIKNSTTCSPTSMIEKHNKRFIHKHSI